MEYIFFKGSTESKNLSTVVNLLTLPIIILIKVIFYDKAKMMSRCTFIYYSFNFTELTRQGAR